MNTEEFKTMVKNRGDVRDMITRVPVFYKNGEKITGEEHDMLTIIESYYDKLARINVWFYDEDSKSILRGIKKANVEYEKRERLKKALDKIQDNYSFGTNWRIEKIKLDVKLQLSGYRWDLNSKLSDEKRETINQLLRQWEVVNMPEIIETIANNHKAYNEKIRKKLESFIKRNELTIN